MNQPFRALLFSLPALVAVMVTPAGAAAQGGLAILRATDSGAPQPVEQARPLDRLAVIAPPGATIEVRDGAGRCYAVLGQSGPPSFRAAGSLGRHEVVVRDADGTEVGRHTFILEAETSIDDGGRYADMFRLFRQGMNTYDPTGVSSIAWNGRTWRYFVNWGLDHNHTMKGMKYFSPVGAEFVDMMRATQREDGMIWSFILDENHTAHYYRTCYGPFGYVRQYGDRTFVRQPSENHPEYIHVSAIHQCWKASGDDAWMRRQLDSAARALDYTVSDRARWSQRFQLLKRVYTIDSWDFQVEDAYTPKLGLTDTMLIDPDKSKFGVFFGDNIYYAAACEELAEMAGHAGDVAMAAKYRDRAAGIRSRLDALAWNGRFFTHFIDEDPAVRRDLGVDEKSQFAQGNAYALNRGIRHDQADAIIRSYLDLKASLPPGSPGEWYTIYPPFGKGFDRHNARWQYMNGGVGGHVAGELARGAFEHGREAYGLDILERLAALGHKHGGKIHFTYTGSIPPPPPPPNYTTVSLARVATMDLEDRGGPTAQPWMQQGQAGDDLRGLPRGHQVFAGIPFDITDPSANDRRAVLAVSRRKGLPASVEIPVNATAGAIHLLHTSSKPTSEGVCGSVSFVYEDGSSRTQYLIMEKHLTYWWFSRLKTDRSAVAWEGPNPVSAQVGLSWCAIDNPEPAKTIRAIRVDAPQDDGIYALAGLTLADRAHYVPPSPISFGGPDNWAAATAMAALVEGLAGVKDGEGSQAYTRPRLSPRWDLAPGTALKAVVRYAPSAGYVAYEYAHAAADRRIVMTATGSGTAADCHLLLPGSATGATRLLVDGAEHPFTAAQVAGSRYIDFSIPLPGPARIEVHY